MKALRESEQRAIELLKMRDGRSETRARLRADPLVQFVLKDAEANVLCPATKLWNTGHGANMMREAVSLMGGYGITEDCPGFLASKWMDAQLEATYEGPEAVQRRQLTVTMTSEVFLAQFRAWTAEMRQHCCDASRHRRMHAGFGDADVAVDAGASAESNGRGRQQALSRTAAGRDVPAGRCAVLAAGIAVPDSGCAGTGAAWSRRSVAADGLAGTVQFLSDLCHVQAAQAAGEVSRICAELVFGYNEHPAWNEEGCTTCCFSAERTG